MNTTMVNGTEPFCSDTKTREGLPPASAKDGPGSESQQVSLQTALAAHPPTPLDPVAQAAPAAPHGAAHMMGGV